MFPLILMQFVSFPDRTDAILSNYAKDSPNKIQINSSGSLGLYYQSKCHKTHPNQTLVGEEKYDWCSNLGTQNVDNPWISFSIYNKAIQLTGYSIRNGCCWYSCCCIDDNKLLDYGCCCRLYSFSLQGSNDNKNWKVIHRVEKDLQFWACKYNTYEFEMTEPFAYLRFVLEGSLDGYQYCMQINQVEFYGKTVDSIRSLDDDYFDDNEESVSIIGKIKKTTE